MNTKPPISPQLNKIMSEHRLSKEKNPAAVALGRLGGKAGRGHVKARTSEQARAAVAVRWNKVRETKRANSETTSTKCETI